MSLSFETKEQYHEWLAAQIAEETKTFPKFRRSSKFALPVSHRRLGTYKKLLDAVFGDCCNVCGFRGRLEMAHLYYMPDSVPPDEHNGRGNLYRMREALENPERFFRLCSVCHDIFDHARRHGGSEYLEKIEGLIQLSKELYDADREVSVEGSIQEV